MAVEWKHSVQKSHNELQEAGKRRSKGVIKIHGVDPFFITAKYKNDQGDTAANLLLANLHLPGSGYWSISRHPNYISEAATFAVFSAFQGPATLACHLPAVFIAGKSPNSWEEVVYVKTKTFTSGFLFVRLWNDETRCLAKYGQYWIQYCFLFVRLWNDETRCLAKYGQYWIQYCNKVPFRILPGIY
ncbi:unnamed protein product [Strongylus vulgaris]|uniref:7-dehydrocholesterol reductase n=1 Tax=Strongylus vulgaris TaxID=40348 RepID=A0A3P7JMF6_STRVU|nr:unnamed protein product [Strongylus vulgaris]